MRYALGIVAILRIAQPKKARIIRIMHMRTPGVDWDSIWCSQSLKNFFV